MKKKIKILCPHIEVADDEVRQIIKPGIINSDKCELVQSSFICPMPINKSTFVDKFKQDGGCWLGHPSLDHEQPRLGTFTEHLPDGRLAEPIWVPYEEDDIDVLLLHGSGPSDRFRAYAKHYKHLPVINVDYKDVPTDRMYVEILDRDRVYNFKRSMVDGETGEISKFPHHIKHAAFCVREDIYAQQSKMLRQYSKRKYDAACFFPITSHYQRHPNEIDRNLEGTLETPARTRGWISAAVKHLYPNSYIGYTSARKDSPQEEGRQGKDIQQPGSTQHVYCDITTNSKIIVTACPYHYEGDYRLMEAMTSGALVMHNKMLIPPAGLVDGEHWIVYEDILDLRNKMEYYTKNVGKAARIADAGRRFVLENHRPHHRVEQWLKEAGLL